MINVVFLRSAEKSFSGLEQRTMRQTVREAVQRTNEFIPVPPVLNITVYPRPQISLKSPDKEFVGGLAQQSDWIAIEVPPALQAPKLQQTVCHELSHLARGYTLTSRHTMADAIIGEGLATALEIHMVPEFPPPYSRYDEEEMEIWAARIKRMMWKAGYSHDRWFFGRGKRWWLGYRLGKYVVDMIAQRHPELTIPQLTKMQTPTLFELSGIYATRENGGQS